MSARRHSWLIGGLAAIGSPAALAHHSVAYYSGERIELAGEITEIRWQNPHIRFALRTTGSGGEKTWRLESSSIFLREKDGVTRDLFRIGDRVRVFGRTSPLRRPSSHQRSSAIRGSRTATRFAVTTVRTRTEICYCAPRRKPRTKLTRCARRSRSKRRRSGPAPGACGTARCWQ